VQIVPYEVEKSGEVGISDSSGLRLLALGDPIQERKDVLCGDFANLPVGEFAQENAR
jgi:hypothetical protein